MESYSQNSNKLDFQHEARILNGIWLITALGLVATAGLAWGAKEGANKQVISSQADSLIKISRIWADFFPANTSNQPI
ncbi:hypothetical protein PJ201_20960, partial [Escherichia coli]|nr:hypothetical protein [Escherichia coli]